MSETLGALINRRFHEEAIKHPGRWKSLADMAKEIGIKQTTFSTYCTDTKRPGSDAADKIAAVLGTEVYDVLGMPRRMPNNPKLNLIASIWSKLPPEKQDEWYETAKSIAEDKQGDHQHKNAS